MPRRTLIQITETIRTQLENDGELSTRQIAIKSKCQWRTAIKALELMKSLGIIAERKESRSKRNERLFRLIK